MSYSKVQELITETLVIKDLYICGRMNQSICQAVTGCAEDQKTSSKNWKKYEELSNSYIRDSIGELIFRKNELTEKLSMGEYTSANTIFDTSYADFDLDLMNDMMLDFYGGIDSIAFASSYNYFSEDFNAILSEFILD
jgi:hypothetical protein